MPKKKCPSTQDKSQSVYQGVRLPFELKIREFNWTEKQKLVIEAGLNKSTNYVLIKAPVGTGKTLLSVYIGLRLLNEGKIKNIYFVRQPVESSSYGLGFLGGDFFQKMEPYTYPMMDQLNELLSEGDIKKLFDGNFIQSIPVGFLKGRTFNSSLIIVDEAEDLTISDFRLAMSRLGKYSRMLIIGDHYQINVKKSGFSDIFNIFNSPECIDNGICCFEFNNKDIMRNKVLAYVIERFGLISEKR